jgi:hypothetical protein
MTTGVEVDMQIDVDLHDLDVLNFDISGAKALDTITIKQKTLGI